MTAREATLQQPPLQGGRRPKDKAMRRPRGAVKGAAGRQLRSADSVVNAANRAARGGGSPKLPLSQLSFGKKGGAKGRGQARAPPRLPKQRARSERM